MKDSLHSGRMRQVQHAGRRETKGGRGSFEVGPPRAKLSPNARIQSRRVGIVTNLQSHISDSHCKRA